MVFLFHAYVFMYSFLYREWSKSGWKGDVKKVPVLSFEMLV